MMSILKITTLAIALIYNSALAADNQDTVATRVYEKVVESVYKVEVKTSGGVLQGSAVAYRYSYDVKGKPISTWLATNAHVVKDGTSISLKNGSGRLPVIYEAKVQYVDPELDIALIEVVGEKIPVVQIIAKSNQVKVGSRVYAIGSPLGLENTISEGIVSGLRNMKKVNVIQTSAAITQGNSGGGLFNAGGELIGITTFKLKGGENLNFAVDAQYILNSGDAILLADFLVGNIEDIYTFSPEQSRAIHSDRLIKWLSRAQTESGEMFASQALLEILENSKKVFSGALSADKFFEKNYRILLRFLSDPVENEKAAQDGAGVAKDAPKNTNRRFECDMTLERSGERRNMPVYIDTTNKTVNSKRSSVIEFSDSNVKWEVGTAVFSFSRYSGKIIYESKGVAVGHGLCHEATVRLF